MVDDLANCPSCGRPVCPTCGPSTSAKVWATFGRFAFVVMILFAISFAVLSYFLFYGGKKLEPARTSWMELLSSSGGFQRT